MVAIWVANVGGRARAFLAPAPALAGLLCVAALLAGCGSPVEIRQPELELGDYIYCPAGVSETGNFSPVGHAAIYVGAGPGDSPYPGEVVERMVIYDGVSPSLRFTSIADIERRYQPWSRARVTTATAEIRHAAADHAADIALRILGGENVPWYSDPFSLLTHNCVQTYQHLYMDVGASVSDMCVPGKYTLRPVEYYEFLSQPRTSPADGPTAEWPAMWRPVPPTEPVPVA